MTYTQLFSRRRLLGAALAVSLLATALLVAQVSTGAAASKRAGTAVVTIKQQGKRLFFDAPSTVKSGQKLEVLNTTKGSQVGPHTFALVQANLRPDTAKERKTCFEGGICLTIAKWLGFKPPNGSVTINPAKAGKAGWDTEGTRSKTGDVWFTGGKKGNHFSQVVSAKAGTTLHFMCAIHPWMQGEIKVTP